MASRPYTSETLGNLSTVSDLKKSLMRRIATYCIEEDIRVLSSLPGVSCIAKTDGYLIWVSNSFVEVTGWTLDELLNNDIWYFIHPDDIEKTEKVYQRQKEGIPVHGFENRWKRKDGQYLTFNWRASEMRSDGLIRANAII